MRAAFPMQYPDHLSMKTIKSYPTNVEADLARIALDAAGIPAVVVGISLGMEGGGAGVQLLVPDDRVEAALTVLGDS
jgi:Putative prokaryotic signal transducing protein